MTIFLTIYSEFKIYRINAARMIAAKASSRNAVSEIVVIG